MVGFFNYFFSMNGMFIFLVFFEQFYAAAKLRQLSVLQRAAVSLKKFWFFFFFFNIIILYKKHILAKFLRVNI
jgi:hypothetical protein